MTRDDRFFKDILETVRKPILALDADLRVLYANHSFYRTFKVTSRETIGNLIYDLGNRQWDIPKLRTLLEEIIPKHNLFNDYQIEHEFPIIGKRIMLLNARRIVKPLEKQQLILLAIEDVTDRMRIEQDLQTSEERFRRTFETAKDGILLIDRTSGVIVNSNQAAQDLLGYSIKGLQKQKIWQIGFLRDARQFQNINKQLKEKGFVDFYDTSVQTRQGKQIAADVYLVDTIKLVQCNIREITARKQAEEALLKAGALQSAIFNSANFSSIATDAKGIIQIFNVGAERMLGYAAADVMNKITPADISDSQELIARAKALNVELSTPITPGFEALVFKASRGIEDIYELTYIRKDGSRFPAVVSVTALRDAENEIIGYLLIGTDNTARKQVEEKLRRNEVLLLQTSRMAKVGGWEIDLQTMTLTWSLETYLIHEVDPSLKPELENAINFYAPEARPIITEAVRRATEEGIAFNLELPFITAKGNHIWIHTIGQVEFRDGKGVRLFGTFQDITDHKQAETEMRSLIRDLQNLSEVEKKSRDQLSYLSRRLVESQEEERRRIARELHDEIGQTLTALTISLDGVSLNAKDDKTRQNIGAVQVLSRDLIRQVNSLSADMHPHVLDDLGLIPGLVALFNRLSTQTGLEVNFKHMGLERIRLAPENEINAYRIIQEALTNIIRHSGSKTASVRLQVERDILYIQIQDEGKGFNLQKVMNALNSMGLLSMKERAEQSGGLFEIQAMPGEGTLITCQLPLVGSHIERRENERGENHPDR